jgi:Mce-associated membrane protein
MSADKPRPGGSRPSGGRPRKVAGRTPEPAAVEEPTVVDEPTVAEEPTVVEEGALTPVSKPPDPEDDGGFETVASATSSTTEEPTVAEVRAEPASKPKGRRTTWVLVAAIAVLAGLAIAEVVYLAVDPAPTVSAERPVVTGEVSHRTAVEAAARATEQILSTSYQDYDGQVDKATERMTDTFAEQYRETAEGIKDDYIAQQTKLQVQAVAQSVAQASPEQVQALLFLNQYVEKVQDGKPVTSYAQYRALVTMVRTDRGWLVSDIQTQ